VTLNNVEATAALVHTGTISRTLWLEAVPAVGQDYHLVIYTRRAMVAVTGCDIGVW
jgi:hypothetical protein